MNQPESESSKKWYARQWIVNVKAQHELILYFIVMAIIFFVSGALSTNIIQRLLTIRANGWHYDRSADFVLLGIVVLFALTSIGIGVVISNRITGPINRIIREMEKAKGGGKLLRIDVRDSDYHRNLVTAFNDVVEQLNKIDSRNDIDPKERL